MKTVGMFRELVPWDDTAPSIADSVGAEPLPDADQIVAYLGLGIPLVDMLDFAKDVLGSGELIGGASSLLTDGVWMWRQDLAFYVRRYHITLPVEFLDTVRGNGYAIPACDEDTLREARQAAAVHAFG